MIKRYRNGKGFTVVELMVVIAILSILITIVTLSYRQIQRSSRDSLRSTNITTFRNALDKFYEANGTYPPGCLSVSCSSWFFTENIVSPFITPATTLTELKAILPELSDTFGDPAAPKGSAPIMNISTTTKKYIYYGGTANLRASGSSSISSPTSASLPCRFHSALTSNNGAASAGSYVVGYYSESDSKWVLYGGKYGTPMTVNSGSVDDGCVINR